MFRLLGVNDIDPSRFAATKFVRCGEWVKRHSLYWLKRLSIKNKHFF